MPRNFSQLTLDNRLTIESLRAQGRSMRSIASVLNVSPSTVSREIDRSGGKACGWYLAVRGQRARKHARADAGVARRKLGPDTSSMAWRHVLAGLRVGWSPEQIAGRLKATSLGPLPAYAVSHETIYSAIYAMPRGALRTELVTLLRRSHSGRLPRARGSARFTGVQDMTPIVHVHGVPTALRTRSGAGMNIRL